MERHIPIPSISIYIWIKHRTYRDILTVTASKSAAEFALRFQPHKEQLIKQNKAIARAGKITRNAPNFTNNQPYQKGQLQEDDEIFDFTDSRFLNPPADSRQNFPLIEEDFTQHGDNGGISIKTPSVYSPHTQYSYNPPPIPPYTSSADYQTDPFVHLGSAYSNPPLTTQYSYYPTPAPYPTYQDKTHSITHDNLSYSYDPQDYSAETHQTVQNPNYYKEISENPSSDQYITQVNL